MSDSDLILRPALDGAFGVLGRALDAHEATLAVREVGLLTRIGNGIATVAGLPGVQSQELLRFPGDLWGLAFNVDRDEVGVVLLDESEGLGAGAEVRRTGRVLDTPVGEALLGRVVDPLGRPLDGQGPVRTAQRLPVEREPRPIMHRAPVTVPLQTGLKVVDALIPIGRGQRELVLGDRQSGKTAIALDTIVNQADKDCLCVYCACGKRAAAVANVVAELRQRGALEYTLVVVATEDDPPGWQFITPYAATTMGEFFMEQGRDVLVVYDDLTRHARAYRELSLLLRRPPGREAYPGDIFYIHSRLLERSTHLRPEHGGGSLSALPIIETEDQNVAAYIPTNLISITDGQIYLTPDLFRKGILPAVDVGKSVSRVGGKTQLPAYRAVAGDLRLAYAQFEELEAFARFGTRLDDDTRRTIERGRRVREVLKQPQFAPLPVPEQIAVLLAVNGGLFDRLALDDVARAQEVVREAVRSLTDLCQRILAGEKLTDADQRQLLDGARAALDEAMPPAKEDDKEQEEAEKTEPADEGDDSTPRESPNRS
ncbi:MAG TPA: alternate F1F0 ATPase, F1 subunit alpha [Planctomycetota bacterium]|nr:alternate F1F0 ATPase, F1 subunit alpha [Planctomycetota bacterium]